MTNKRYLNAEYLCLLLLHLVILCKDASLVWRFNIHCFYQLLLFLLYVTMILLCVYTYINIYLNYLYKQVIAINQD